MKRSQSSRLTALEAHPRLAAKHWRSLIGRPMQTWSEPEFLEWFSAALKGDKGAEAVLDHVSTEDLEWLLRLVREEQVRVSAQAVADRTDVGE